MGGLFGGGGYDAPEVQLPAVKQASKSKSASATAAADAQTEKARKNRGLTASIMTDRTIGSGGLTANANGNSTFG